MTTTITPSETSVSWRVDDIDVDATLTRPESNGPSAAVVLVAGSGPTDRNWNSPLIPGTNGSGALLAHTLSDLGYITLRYDKRTSGPHGKENATRLAGKISMQGHMEELAGAVRFIAEQRDVDRRQIFALTNSEGCIHALNYQLRATDLPFAGLVLTSAPARPVGRVAHAQLEAQLKSVPNGDKLLAAYDTAIADFTSGRPVEVEKGLPESLSAMILGISNPINQPFARELWATNPAALLARVTTPTLIVFGRKDIQVDWQVDGPILEAVASTRPNIRVAYVSNANHVLKYEPRDKTQLSAGDVANNYNSAESMLDHEAVDIIASWLAAQRRLITPS